MSDIVVAKLECPVCGHEADFVLSKDAVIDSLIDINWKERVKQAIDKGIIFFHKDNPIAKHWGEESLRWLKEELEL